MGTSGSPCPVVLQALDGLLERGALCGGGGGGGGVLGCGRGGGDGTAHADGAAGGTQGGVRRARAGYGYRRHLATVPCATGRWGGGGGEPLAGACVVRAGGAHPDAHRGGDGALHDAWSTRGARGAAAMGVLEEHRAHKPINRRGKWITCGGFPRARDGTLPLPPVTSITTRALNTAYGMHATAVRMTALGLLRSRSAPHVGVAAPGVRRAAAVVAARRGFSRAVAAEGNADGAASSSPPSTSDLILPSHASKAGGLLRTSSSNARRCMTHPQGGCSCRRADSVRGGLTVV